MLKQFAALEVKIGDRFYRLLCDADAPLGEVHDAIVQMRAHVVGKINEAHKAEQPKDESCPSP